MSENIYDKPISTINGVGKTREAQLNKLGIHTLSDLVYFLPRAYQNRGFTMKLSETPYNTYGSLLLTVLSEVESFRPKNSLTITRFRAGDSSKSLNVVFYNAPYVRDVFHVGETFRFWAKTSYNNNGDLQLVNPEYEACIPGVPLPPIYPVYRLTQGITTKYINKITRSAISELLPGIKDHIPDKIRLSYGLPTLTYALNQAHFPSSSVELRKALSRLAFDEMLEFGIGIQMMSRLRERGKGVKLSPCSLDELTSSLPFELTSSQKEVINEIYRDTVLNGEKPMARILVGDVGSGKTICAIYAMYIAVKSGYQAALMAPTEILANQHYKTVSGFLSKLGVHVELLTGTTSQKEKKRIYNSVATGETQIVIGTHALISDKLEFSNLALTVTDEQHRFGVSQRGQLKDKTKGSHMLVMSATPIPRTLALSMYGDLDVSKITAPPKGRQKVDTFVVNESYRERLLTFMQRQIALGGQCYVVCSAIDDVGDNDGVVSVFTIQNFINNAPKPKNVIDFTEFLKNAMPDIPIASLHGRMKPQEKEEIMAAFERGETKILVSTTVIEVGIDVPNASVIVIEDADRFGLAQLHQLRGRVGRGERKSYCILVSRSHEDKAKVRMETIRDSHDGFEIAEKDLTLRGPGDFFVNHDDNIRQSGGFEFRIAKLCDDFELYKKAFEAAKHIVDNDPTLSREENLLLREKVQKFMPHITSTIS